MNYFEFWVNHNEVSINTNHFININIKFYSNFIYRLFPSKMQNHYQPLEISWIFLKKNSASSQKHLKLLQFISFFLWKKTLCTMSDQAVEAIISPAKDENQNKDTPVSICWCKFSDKNERRYRRKMFAPPSLCGFSCDLDNLQKLKEQSETWYIVLFKSSERYCAR